MNEETKKLLNSIFFNTEIDVNNCKPDSCLNDGKCFSNVKGFKCQCKPDFTGTRCETSKLIHFLSKY